MKKLVELKKRWNTRKGSIHAFWFMIEPGGTVTWKDHVFYRVELLGLMDLISFIQGLRCRLFGHKMHVEEYVGSDSASAEWECSRCNYSGSHIYY